MEQAKVVRVPYTAQRVGKAGSSRSSESAGTQGTSQPRIHVPGNNASQVSTSQPLGAHHVGVGDPFDEPRVESDPGQQGDRGGATN